MAILKLYKRIGETPLECLKRFQGKNKNYKTEKMTYAGRLDPLAEGLLLVITGKDIKNKEKYLGLNKEYEVDILFGFSTDTYDILGMVTDQSLNLPKYDNKEWKEILKSFVRKFSQKYPPYSSKFFVRAKSGELKDREITSKNVEIKNIKFLNQKIILKGRLVKYIYNSVNLVHGDFRQKKILNLWNKKLKKTVQKNFSVISLKVKCTSGTYMRSLANEIGKKIGTPALALNIKRTKVGKFKL